MNHLSNRTSQRSRDLQPDGHEIGLCRLGELGSTDLQDLRSVIRPESGQRTEDLARGLATKSQLRARRMMQLDSLPAKPSLPAIAVSTRCPVAEGVRHQLQKQERQRHVGGTPYGVADRKGPISRLFNDQPRSGNGFSAPSSSSPDGSALMGWPPEVMTVPTTEATGSCQPESPASAPCPISPATSASRTVVSWRSSSSGRT
jgi:hypothetical protein